MSSGDFKPEVGIIISKINNNSALSGILLDLREFDALNFHSVKWEKKNKRVTFWILFGICGWIFSLITALFGTGH